jgi:MFS family permease
MSVEAGVETGGDGAARPRPSGSTTGTVFLTVFLDIVGFSILFPLFPALLDHYVRMEGPTSVVGELGTFLRDVSGGDDHAIVTLFGGVLGAAYSFLQFLFAPIWGGLSDRIGRRPTLLFTLAGTLASSVLWVFAGSFTLLIAARLLGGIMAGNISTATAVVADTTSGKGRAGGMGMVGMAIGLGFILGPAIGGLTSTVVLGGPGPDGAWGGGLAFNPFSGPALAAALLGLVNLVWVAMRLPETLPPERRGTSTGRRSWNPLRALLATRLPGVVRTTLVSFLYMTSFAAMEFTLTFLAVERLAYTARDNAWMFVFVGLVIAFVQGGLVRRLAPRLGERRLVLAGLVLLLPGLVAIALAAGSAALYTGLFFLAVGSALVMPCLSSLVSRYCPADRQGMVLGQFRSAGALARALGPLAGGLLYWRLGSAAPYWTGAAFLLLPLLLASRLPPVPTGSTAQEGG